ncbi:hypothetical protein [Priestia megaterium]|nr:hypothetical protein [Priestia megaterium]
MIRGGGYEGKYRVKEREEAVRGDEGVGKEGEGWGVDEEESVKERG